jgi:hypothetical protein
LAGWWGAQPLLQRLLEPLDLATGGGLVRAAVFCSTLERRSSASKALRPPRPPAKRVVKTIPLSVKVEAGTPKRAITSVSPPGELGPHQVVPFRLGG